MVLRLLFPLRRCRRNEAHSCDGFLEGDNSGSLLLVRVRGVPVDVRMCFSRSVTKSLLTSMKKIKQIGTGREYLPSLTFYERHVWESHDCALQVADLNIAVA